MNFDDIIISESNKDENKSLHDGHIFLNVAVDCMDFNYHNTNTLTNNSEITANVPHINEETNDKNNILFKQIEDRDSENQIEQQGKLYRCTKSEENMRCIWLDALNPCSKIFTPNESYLLTYRNASLVKCLTNNHIDHVEEYNKILENVESITNDAELSIVH